MRKGEVAIDSDAIGLLKAGRNALHWSQEDLANESGVSIATIRRVESKVQSITEEVCGKFDLKPDFCVRREKIEALLRALNKHGVSVWKDETAAGLTVKTIRDQEIFEIAKQIDSGQ
ncbi:helix-turn-helix domain-containing protein [Pseudosulfitobacter koreensis]|uniref:Helix-turn-helix domain-containing protein n=1 Tax=Pseudosulfitobacter koreensis TaxID=2968472 RepID=A0ABT1YZF1_9RHOB|nr:helix-turn-helix transcriptional regulator [Pseudosulfitobacter koreense]MCR8826276.1 helix-turn-helix domain-containing protein [Pseudosulfitobacter koreense]